MTPGQHRLDRPTGGDGLPVDGDVCGGEIETEPADFFHGAFGELEQGTLLRAGRPAVDPPELGELFGQPGEVLVVAVRFVQTGASLGGRRGHCRRHQRALLLAPRWVLAQDVQTLRWVGGAGGGPAGLGGMGTSTLCGFVDVDSAADAGCAAAPSRQHLGVIGSRLVYCAVRPKRR